MTAPTGSPPPARGEVPLAGLLTCWEGSPPPARGEDNIVGYNVQWSGITPACAGRSHYNRNSRFAAWDHPRLRGEKKGFCRSRRLCTGSPPPARGEGPQKPHIIGSSGITPACAGRSEGDIFGVSIDRDHPRLRGEKSTSTSVSACSAGSPPPARGEGGYCYDDKPYWGITPACAGRRLSKRMLAEFMKDHPRLRGEKRFRWGLSPANRGSPPPARGEGRGCCLLASTGRITPACAGRSKDVCAHAG